MQADLVDRGMDKLHGAEGMHILRYVAAIYRCLPAQDARSRYDPAVVARALGRLSPEEREAVVDYFCDLCELLDQTPENEPLDSELTHAS
jgi:hypothetical protein